MTNVDFVAKAVCVLASRPGYFHIFNPNASPTLKTLAVAANRFLQEQNRREEVEVELVPFSEWKNCLREENSKPDSINPLLPLLSYFDMGASCLVLLYIFYISYLILRLPYAPSLW
jgi:hypothetical protein